MFQSSHVGPSLPVDVYPGLTPAPNFPTLIRQADEFVRQSRNRDACCDYARALIGDGQGIDVSLAAKHLDRMRRDVCRGPI
jgi:hypothetical protein